MPGLIRGVARTAVVAGTATAVSGRVNRRQQAKWAAQDQPAEQQSPPPPQVVYEAPPATSADGSSDHITQLKELADLHTQGALTDEEFAAEKAKILGS